MATVILVRHGRTTANASGVLAGRTAGVALDDVGRTQAQATAERLAAVPLVGVVSSPLERCKQTAAAIVAAQEGRPRRSTERGITECDYGDWQGQALKVLAKEPLWKVVQTQPSAAAFPGGESLTAMQARAVAAVRRHDAAVEAEHGPGAVWVAPDLVVQVRFHEWTSGAVLRAPRFQGVRDDKPAAEVVRET